MPYYIFQNPENEDEYVEVLQKMNDEHVFVDENGLEWKRVYTVPQAMMDSKIDPWSSKQFVEKTKNAGTMGDLWDRAAELSEKRRDKVGADDPLKTKAIKNYEKERGGAKYVPPAPKKKTVTVKW